MEETVEKQKFKLYEQFQSVNSIPKEYYSEYDVKRGLRNADGTGVIAGVTNISNVHGYLISDGLKVPDEGKLTFRGYDIYDLLGADTESHRSADAEAKAHAKAERRAVAVSDADPHREQDGDVIDQGSAGLHQVQPEDRSDSCHGASLHGYRTEKIPQPHQDAAERQTCHRDHDRFTKFLQKLHHLSCSSNYLSQWEKIPTS